MTKINDGGTSGTIGADRLTNRTRKIYVPGATFVSSIDSGTSTNMNGSLNAGSSAIARRADAWRLLENPTGSNTAPDYMTATFMVPADYVAGQEIPKLSISWGTDDSDATAANRRCALDISFCKSGEVTNADGTNGLKIRYTIRANAAAGNNSEMLSDTPAQGSITTQSMESGDSYLNSPTTWAAGDIIVITISRRDLQGNTTDDPNDGSVFIFGVSFDYSSDM